MPAAVFTALKSVVVGFLFCIISYVLSGSEASIPVGLAVGYIHWMLTSHRKRPADMQARMKVIQGAMDG